MVITSGHVHHSFLRCLTQQFAFFFSFRVLPRILDNKDLLRFVSFAMCLPAEESVEEAWNINVERRPQLILQRVIKVFPVLGCIDEAACVEGDGSLVRIG